MTDLALSLAPASFRAIIDLWPSREAMAADIGDVAAAAVSKWWQRNNIPAPFWAALLLTERASAAGITPELLTSLAARKLEVADFDEARA